MPESLKDNVEHYQSLYTTYMQQYSKHLDENQPHYTAKPIVSIIQNNPQLFMFNHTAMSTQQYLNNPIIVVTTPHALGKTSSAKTFWTNALSYNMFFKGYNETINLLKKHNTFPYISYVRNSRTSYYEQVENIRLDTTMALFGAVLGTLTSILLFNSMNLLYFEQFRKDILIKRISGMSFFALHQDYLLLQCIVISIGFVGGVWLTKLPWIGFSTFCIFAINAIFTLFQQMKAEEQTALTVLKGK